MAAYAALVSLINLTEDIKNHSRLSASLDKKQIASLGETVGFLLEFIESYDCHGGNKEAAENLEIEIASAAHAAEDVMESHIVDQIHQDAISNENSLICLLDLQKVIHEMDYVKEKVIKIEEERGFKYKRPKYSTPYANSSSTPPSTRRNSMVGVEEELMQLMDVLTGQQSGRQIISIIGTGGIGKTTLAKHVYEDAVIMRHFDFCAWATITQEYNVQEILSELLYSKRESASEAVYELGERLHKKLSGRRYLIILDDMWSCEVWDKIKFFFPDNGNRSRIVITTRLSNIAIHFSSSSLVMKFLDQHKSWKLFCEKSFIGEEGCPQELEEIGKRIVKRCRGLPLAIVVIGRHLGKSSGMMKEYWESVANDISSILDSREDEQCLEILSLSYYHLPTHLKSCFLYMGIFKEDNEIFMPSLIDLWVAEGILKPNKTHSLDEIAEDYINDLADRNLILVTRSDRGGRIGFVKMHDILRELCIKVAKKEKFFCMLDGPRSIHRERRVVIHEKITEKKHEAEVFHALQAPPPPLVRSLKCEGGSELSFDLRLLRVVNHVEVEPTKGSFEACFQQVNLRYIDCRLVRSMHDSDMNPSPSQPLNLHLPPSIILLWNLQTLSIGGAYDQIIAPPEIWKMSQLRHVSVSRIYLPDPPQSDGSDNLVLEKLQTLDAVENLRLSEEVCKKIPNIKNLTVRYNAASSGYFPHSVNLGGCSKLETLHCCFSGQSWNDFGSCITFPSSLRRLALVNAWLRSEDLTTIGWLPHLTVLVLLNSAYGPKWDPVERAFPSLKRLRIYGWRDLTCWNAERSHFPVLERLDVSDALKLDEIPLDIGEIATLECIKLQGCSVSASMSAVRILVEQEDLGNDGLQVQIHFQEEKEVESFREMVEEEGFTCNKLLVALTGSGEDYLTGSEDDDPSL